MGGLTMGQGCGCSKCGQMEKMVKHAQKKTGMKSVSMPSASGVANKSNGGSIYK